ncbi:MAG TPA: carbohydrate ABC transporter permease [Thermomicrobiales bacterium]|jgi:multiple sugar transport system permease protein|nr:carbohydrate ABC transporter permease [Thermomicrobiales bacterium]
MSSGAYQAGTTWTPPSIRRHGKPVRWYVTIAILWVSALLFLFPFVWMVVSSLKRDIDVFRLPIEWIPDPVSFFGYERVWTGNYPITRFMGNSVIVAVCRVFGEVLTASLAAYAFARMEFRFKNLIFVLYLATMIIPHQMLLVPRFILYQEIGIHDTLWALILPGMFTVFGTFLLRQFFMGIPKDLTDAAKMDGASELQCYYQIVMPLAKPAIASLMILAFVWSWNDYETPLVMLTSEEIFTIPIGLTRYMDEGGGMSPSLAMAGAVSSIVPVIVVFLILQRQFIQALTRTGMKG